jgi:hypothetical protein
MRELRIPTRKTNQIHNDVPENTTFLLLDQQSGEKKKQYVSNYPVDLGICQVQLSHALGRCCRLGHQPSLGVPWTCPAPKIRCLGLGYLSSAITLNLTVAMSKSNGSDMHVALLLPWTCPVKKTVGVI